MIVTGKRRSKEQVDMNTTLDLSELNGMIGQLFMAGLPGPQIDKATEALIRDHYLGGIILFSRNVEDPVQVAGLCKDLQETAMNYHGLPLFLAVDQEGGRVARLREPFTVFPGNQAIGMSNHPLRMATEFGRVTAREMKMVGLNMDLAPVMDVQKGETEKHLEGRLFGEDPDRVSRLGRRVVKALQKNGVMAVAKHFPGLGRADLDPHLNLPRISTALEDIETDNLPPFRAAIEEGVSAVMTSHAVYTALDPDHPATLSSAVLGSLLREKMGFQGLIITDDLEMGAVADHFGVAQGAEGALKAGADILLICKDQEKVVESIERIRNKVLRGEISFQRLKESHRRILHTKETFIKTKRRISLTRVKKHFKA